MLFDAVMKTEGARVNGVLEVQRRRIAASEMSISKIERLILGSDAQLKIEKQAEWFNMQVESCRECSSDTDADAAKPWGAK